MQYVPLTLVEATKFFSDLYRGEHHIPGDVKKYGLGFSVLHIGDLSTYDWDTLTRLVFLAHDYGYRAEIQPAMRYVRISIWRRDRSGSMTEGHPTLEGAVATWRERWKEKLYIRVPVKVHP